MKKIGLTFMIGLFVTCLWMIGNAQAHWHGYYRGWGPGIYLRGPVVVGPPRYPNVYYPAQPVVVQQAPVYVQPQEAATYWYYCKNPKGYYPFVGSCPDGWMKVAPNTNPQTAPRN